MSTIKKFVIEFRSGSYFQNIESRSGGPMKTAKQFASVDEADQFMSEHVWILFNGGMVIIFNTNK